jgi:hypothetical protein
MDDEHFKMVRDEHRRTDMTLQTYIKEVAVSELRELFAPEPVRYEGNRHEHRKLARKARRA